MNPYAWSLLTVLALALAGAVSTPVYVPISQSDSDLSAVAAASNADSADPKPVLDPDSVASDLYELVLQSDTNSETAPMPPPAESVPVDSAPYSPTCSRSDAVPAPLHTVDDDADVELEHPHVVPSPVSFDIDSENVPATGQRWSELRGLLSAVVQCPRASASLLLSAATRAFSRRQQFEALVADTDDAAENMANSPDSRSSDLALCSGLVVSMLSAAVAFLRRIWLKVNFDEVVSKVRRFLGALLVAWCLVVLARAVNLAPGPLSPCADFLPARMRDGQFVEERLQVPWRSLDYPNYLIEDRLGRNAKFVFDGDAERNVWRLERPRPQCSDRAESETEDEPTPIGYLLRPALHPGSLSASLNRSALPLRRVDLRPSGLRFVLRLDNQSFRSDEGLFDHVPFRKVERLTFGSAIEGDPVGRFHAPLGVVVASGDYGYRLCFPKQDDDAADLAVGFALGVAAIGWDLRYHH